VCRPVRACQAGNCSHERHGRASGRCGQATQPAIIDSEGREMCREARERPKRTVGHPADEMDRGGRRAKG